MMSSLVQIADFEKAFSFESLILSWQEFRKGKRCKSDVAAFEANAITNLMKLRDEIQSGCYKHGGYKYFKTFDPKPRDIHKASVRDRIVHHAVHRALYGYFDSKFIHDSYSCRIGKGTHRALRRYAEFVTKESKNHTKTVWVLSCDIRKCFASVDHCILLDILRKHVDSPEFFAILQEIIGSFFADSGRGIPLGNLTSQLFVNVYLNGLDQFVKRVIKARFYIRYADDFVVISRDRNFLCQAAVAVNRFLRDELNLSLHPYKIGMRTASSGVDFLGWAHFSKHRVLRATTRRRMMRKVRGSNNHSVISSYLGLLSHGNGYTLSRSLQSHSLC